MSTLRSGLCYRKSVCRLLPVTFVHPTQGLKLSVIFLRRCVPWPLSDLRAKFYGDRPEGTQPSIGGVKRKRGNKIERDFGPVEGYISRTVASVGLQDTASGTINGW